MPAINIDPCTASVTPLECYFGGTLLSTATGYYWDVNGQVWLVTNWHVVTGRHPVTGEHQSATAGEPDLLKIDTFAGRNLNRRGQAVIKLRDDDGAPTWREHARWRSAADVVGIPLGEIGQHVIPLNTMPQLDAHVSVGNDVFVLGYPRGIGPERLAIWKRASIASEPDIDVDGCPLLLVDTATAKGMSGAPVIHRFRDLAREAGGSMIMGGDAFHLLGTYAGRLAGDSLAEVTLGRVWKARLLEEIARSGVEGSREPRSEATLFDFSNFTVGSLSLSG